MLEMIYPTRHLPDWVMVSMCEMGPDPVPNPSFNGFRLENIIDVPNLCSKPVPIFGELGFGWVQIFVALDPLGPCCDSHSLSLCIYIYKYC